MTLNEFLHNLSDNYSIVNILSSKNNCKVYRMRNNNLKKIW